MTGWEKVGGGQCRHLSLVAGLLTIGPLLCSLLLRQGIILDRLQEGHEPTSQVPG
jgi:hypothetical protein